MNIIKINAIDSTNTYLKQMSSSVAVDDYTVVVTEHQYKGRGQMGNSWESETGKNLMFSVVKSFVNLKIEQQFYVSMCAALSVYKTLKEFEIPRLAVKWPNDILSANKKVCGILIENVLKEDRCSFSIIGVGINVNQDQFVDLPQASSLKRITGKVFDKNEILESFINHLKYFLSKLELHQFDFIKTNYETVLFKKQIPSTFLDVKTNEKFMGIIDGINENGTLRIKFEEGNVCSYNLKEIKLLY